MFEPGPNDALSQNFMKLGLLVAEKKRGQTDTHTRFMFYKYRYGRAVRQAFHLIMPYAQWGAMVSLGENHFFRIII